MSDMRLSPATKALLSAARGDGPSAASRAHVWAGVSGAVGAAAGATSLASAAGGTGAKALLLGTLLGGTATVGLALGLLYVGPSRLPSHGAMPVAIAATARLAPLAAAMPDPRPADSSGAFRPVSSTVATDARGALGSAPPALSSPCWRSPRKNPPPLAAEDPLAYEASLIAEARGALADGDARSALRAIRAAGALPSRQLVPEELAVEAQALRSLGRSADAKDVGDMLKKRFPESALAR